jgi:hypothetical protein
MKHLFIITIFLFVSVASSAQWLGMEINQNIETNTRMYHLTLAHTNRDEFPDLVALPVDAYNSARIYRGNSENNFDYSSSLQKDENYRVMVAGDIDDDGIDDLVISGYWHNGFKIFWGNENGSHTESQHYVLTGHGKNVQLADLNQDGALDIIALSGGSGQAITMHLFHGNKSRVLTPAGIFGSVLHTDKRITITDKDKNGLPDVMIASSFPWFVIFYQQANGNFVPRYWPYQLELPFTSEYHLVDLNNDSKEDIVANYMGEGFRFYEGKNDTLFSEQYIEYKTDVKPYRIFFTDLNKDGFLDMVTDHQNAEYEMTDQVYYFLGNGDFTFQQPQLIQLPGALQSLLVKDFNGDDYTDIIVSCVDKGIVTILNAGMVTGTEEDETSVSVFPNPFTNHLELNLSSYPATVAIYDSRGTMMEKTFADESKLVNTTSWPAGIYILRVVTSKGFVTQKVIRR